LEKRSPWLLGDTFTAADVSVGYALMLADQLDMTDEFTSGIAAYWKRLQERPGFQQALEHQTRAARAQGIA